MFKPTAGIFHFESAVMFICFWPQADFLDFDLGLRFASLTFLFGLFENEFSQINDFDYGRVRVCGYFNQIKSGFSCSLLGNIDCDYAPVFPIGID
jgi:hypothetical protein